MRCRSIPCNGRSRCLVTTTAPGVTLLVATAAGAMPSVALSADAVLCVRHCATHRSNVCCNGQIAITTSALPCVVTVTDSVRPLQRLQALHYHSRRRPSQRYVLSVRTSYRPAMVSHACPPPCVAELQQAMPLTGASDTRHSRQQRPS